MATEQEAVIGDGTNATLSTVSASADELLDSSKLLVVISKFDALTIFSMAKDGIEADVSAPSKIGLTRKQYYTRLMQLKDAGLIEKKGNMYYQTTKGSFLYEKCVNTVIHAIRNSKQMAMIDVLKRQGRFTEEDLQRMKTSVLMIPKATEFEK